MAKTATKTLKKPKPKQDFSVTFEFGGDKQTTKGVDVLDCIRKMKAPSVVKSAGTFYVEYPKKVEGGTKTIRQFSKVPIQVNGTKIKQIFGKDIEKQLLAKRLSILM